MHSQRPVVLITGSSGLIGSAAVHNFADRYTVVGFDLQERPDSEAAFIEADLSSDASVRAGLQQLRERHGERLAAVIHLAAYYDFSGEPSPKYEDITVRGTERLVQGLKDFQVDQFVFSSTMLVHLSSQPGTPINEDWPLEPKWDYPLSKVQTEQLLRAEHDCIPLAILRIAGVYTDECDSIPLAHQIQRIRERWYTGTVYPGDLSHGQAFLHRDDLVAALNSLVERRARLPEELILLLGEPETLSYDTLQREIAQLIHHEEWETHQISRILATTGAWVQEHLPFVDDPFIKPWMIDMADDHYELDISRARQLLGWEPRHSLKNTLPKMIAALKADPLAWYQHHQLKPPAELKTTVGA